MFWNATFAHSRTLEYPETLRYIKEITSGNDIKIDSVVTFLRADNNPSTIHQQSICCESLFSGTLNMNGPGDPL